MKSLYLRLELLLAHQKFFPLLDLCKNLNNFIAMNYLKDHFDKLQLQWRWLNHREFLESHEDYEHPLCHECLASTLKYLVSMKMKNLKLHRQKHQQLNLHQDL